MDNKANGDKVLDIPTKPEDRERALTQLMQITFAEQSDRLSENNMPPASALDTAHVTKLVFSLPDEPEYLASLVKVNPDNSTED